MTIQTERLLLRPWKSSDAAALFAFASDPDIGPPAGWPAHKSVEESRAVIETVLCGKEAYAVCQRETGKLLGAIELKLCGHSDLAQCNSECELGFWIGKPFWGQGLIPEAAKSLLRRAFTELSMEKVWCAYYDGNEKSKRAQEKIGFRFHHTSENVPVPLLGETRKGHVNLMTKEDWIEQRSLEHDRT